MKKRKSIFSKTLLAGIASSASVYEVSSYPTLGGTDLDRLRQYSVRIGKDFSDVISRENDKKEKSGYSEQAENVE